MSSFLFRFNYFTIFFIFLCVFNGCNDNAHDIKNPKAQTIKKNITEHGLLKTVHGNLIISFYENEAPNTINRIKDLIHKGFYDGLIFHRVIPDFIIQTGDPSNTGKLGSGINLKDEFSSLKHLKGTLSMARDPSKADSADSQFYICLKSLPELDNKYTIFGHIKKGISILDKIKRGDRILSFSIVNSIK